MAQIFGNLSKNFNAKIFGNSKFLNKITYFAKTAKYFWIAQIAEISHNLQELPKISKLHKFSKIAEIALITRGHGSERDFSLVITKYSGSNFQNFHNCGNSGHSNCN